MEFVTERERIYANDATGKLIAEITFPTDDGRATINHTYIDESLRGQGFADRLMRLAIDKIKADGHEIAATCPYAVLWLRRHPQDTE